MGTGTDTDIDYTDLFAKLGKFVCITNRLLDVQKLIASDYVTDVLDEYSTDIEDAEVIDGFTSAFVASATSLENTIDTVLFYVNRTLAEKQDELFSPSTDPATLLNLLNLRMIEDSTSIFANTVTTPVVTAATTNNGNGVVLASEINVDGRDDERVFNETVQFRCTSDRFTGSPNPVFNVTGLPEFSRLSWRDLGNGSDTTSVSIGQTLISNGDFESFSDDVPGSWTTDSGADIIKIEETLQYRGDSALFLESDAATTTALLSQDITLQKDTIYCMTVRLRKVAAVDGTSNFNIYIDTENETMGGARIDVFDADPATLTTSYVLYNVFFTLPEARTEDQLTVFITWEDADGVTSGRGVLVDDIIISPAFIFGNTAYVIVPGSDDWIIDDYVNVVTENSRDALFQTFFGRFYDFQFNSSSVGGETIDDALAEDCPSICDSGT